MYKSVIEKAQVCIIQNTETIYIASIQLFCLNIKTLKLCSNRGSNSTS